MKPSAAQRASRLRLLKLEPRLLFDGAAAAEVAQDLAHDDGALQAAAQAAHAVADAGAAPAAAVSAGSAHAADGGAAVGAALSQAQSLLQGFAASGQAADALASLLRPGQTVDAAWRQAAEQALQGWAAGPAPVRIELRASADMGGALGAYAAQGPDGQPVIYLDASYAAQASTQALRAVLLEEIGHALDHALNGAADAPGDEGHAFASLLTTGQAHQAAVAGENDHGTVQIDGQAVAVERAGPYAIAQLHYVPLPEPDVKTALTAISSNVSGTIETVIAISATSNGTIVVYDHWEDGYEADIGNPLQATTQVWGDDNAANGYIDRNNNGSFDAGEDTLSAGQSIVLRNAVNPGSPSTVDYDGRDKIGSTTAVSVTKAGWSSTPGTVLAGAVAVVDAGNAGKVYTLPIGQNVSTVATGTNKLFEYTSAHIIATAANTTVQIDKDGNGSFETTVTLANAGDTYLVNGGLNAGGRIVADKGVAVYVIAGDVGSSYENRWFTLTPDEQWASSYYAPVGTTLAADPTYVVLYNPDPTNAITVRYDTATQAGQTVTVGPKGTGYVLMPASAAHFYTVNGAKFYAVSVIDADATANQTHDWSYSLVPETYLTTKFVVAWGPGNNNVPATGAANGSPVWVTATDDTTLYIDNAAGVTVRDSRGAVVAGTRVGSTDTFQYEVTELESYRLFDSDNDQSGLTVYTTDGTLITAAWGEDPSIAGPGNPYLDLGTTVLPFPDYVFSKVSTEASRVTYGNAASDDDTQVELGEQIEFTISVTNRAVIDLFNINIKDALVVPTGATASDIGSYVAGSTWLTIIRADGTVVVDQQIADKVLGGGATSIFPLEKVDGGYTLTDADPATQAIDGLKRGDQVVIKYRVQVPNGVTPSLALAGFTVTNDAEMTGNPAGTNTAIPSKITTNQTIISVNGTADGQVFLKDAAFNGVAGTFATGATLGVEVVDADANVSSSTADTLTVTVFNTATGESEQVTLTETGLATGIFRGTLATATAASADNSGTLQMRTGDTVRVDYTDPVYGAAFDRPDRPGVAGDADNDPATGLANQAYASVPVPSQTKTLYLSDDSANNLDRQLPPGSDTTAATTPLIQASSGSGVTVITDNFSSNSFSGGSGWTGNWTEIGESDGRSQGAARIDSGQMYLRDANSRGFSRSFAALPAPATLTFDIRDTSTTRQFEDSDTITVSEFVGGSWVAVGTINGTGLTTTASTKTFSLSAGATGLRLVASSGSSDRVYIDNIRIATGQLSTASTASGTDYALSASVDGGQTFSFSGSGASTDAIDVKSLTLSLKKTGNTAATATVSIRNAWDGSVLWSGTVSTSALSTSYRDVSLAVSGLVLDKNATYVLRVDSNASGIVWQGGSTDSYAQGSRLSTTGAAASGDMRFAVEGVGVPLSTVSFSQSLSMTSDFVIPAGGVIKVVTHVTGETNLADGQNITATLSAGGSTLASAGQPDYDAAAHTLTWTFQGLSSARTIAAGQAVTLAISNAQSGTSFRIAYDSGATPSRIELPTHTVISLVDADPVTAGVQEIGFFSESLANGGTPNTAGAANAGDIVYIRVKVADPFGDYDVSSLDLQIDGPGAGGASGDLTLSLADAYVVDAGQDGRGFKTYEYAWQTRYVTGLYDVSVTAHEGLEGTVQDSASAQMVVTATDLGTPSSTQFLTALSSGGGVVAGAVLPLGSDAVLRVTDLDESGAGTVTAVVDGYTVTLTETATPGIFEADLSDPSVHVSNTHADPNPAAYFTAMPAGRALSASYVDDDDGSDTSSDSVVVNSAPDAQANARSVAMNRQATGNVLTDNDGSGTDSDPNGQTLRVTAVNGSTVAVDDVITLASGARLIVRGDGSYLYDPSTLTSPPTSGSPVTDSFTYTVADTQGETDTATVTLTVTYVNPTVLDNQTATDGQEVEVDVSGKFADVVADRYTATGLPPGLSIDPDTGIISGTLTSGASASGPYSVSITTTELDDNGDPTGTPTTRSFTWTVTNVAPVAVDDAAATRTGVAVSGNVRSNDADGAPDADTLTVTSFTIAGDPTVYTAGSTPRSIAGVGTITLAASGAYTFTPAAGFIGGSVPAITYTVSDGNGGTDTAVLSLAVIGVTDVTVNEAAGQAEFEVHGVAGETVSLQLANGTATQDANGVPVLDGSEDFGPGLEVSADGGSTWQAYASSAVLSGSGRLLVRTPVLNDTLYEGAHGFTLRATQAGGVWDEGSATIVDDGSGSGGSNDDRPAFSVDDVTVNEAAGTLTFTVTKTGATATSASVAYATANGTATAGAGGDYTASSGTLTFAANEASKTVTISIANDAVFEGSEGLVLNLSGATGATIADAQGNATILDDGTGSGGSNDDRPSFSVNDVTVNEAAGTLTFTVTKTGSTTQAASVSYATADGSATAGADYTAATGTLSFAANETSKTVTVTIADDAVYEGAETLLIDLSNASGAVIADAQGVGTVRDDGAGSGGTDDDRPAFSVDDVTVNEAAGTLSFTVSRSGSVGLPATVAYATANGTATAGADYTAASGTLSFAANQTSQTVTINIADDAAYEGAETFTLTLSSPTDARLTDSQGVGTIVDDGTGSGGTDDDRSLALTGGGLINEGSPYAVFTVTGQDGQVVELSLGNTASTADADAAIGGFSFEYSVDGVNWTAYTWNGVSGNRPTLPVGGVIHVRVAIGSEADAAYEGPETFTLSARYATNTAIQAMGTATIVDDGSGQRQVGTVTGGLPDPDGGVPDDDRSVDVDDLSVNEGSPHAVFRVTGQPGTLVQLTLTGLTATPGGVDFGTGGPDSLQVSTDGGQTWVNVTGPVVLPGSGELRVRTPLVDDGILDGGEQLRLTATVVGGSAVAVGTATIVDTGGGVVYGDSGEVDPTGRRTDDTPVVLAAPEPLRHIEAGAILPTAVALQPAMEPALHVLPAVADARRQGAELGQAGVEPGEIQSASIGAGLGMDIALHVLPAVDAVEREGRSLQQITAARQGALLGEPGDLDGARALLGYEPILVPAAAGRDGEVERPGDPRREELRRARAAGAALAQDTAPAGPESGQVPAAPAAPAAPDDAPGAVRPEPAAQAAPTATPAPAVARKTFSDQLREARAQRQAWRPAA